MFAAKGLSSVRLMTSVGLVALLVQPLAAEPLVPEPRERSTPETIGFQPVEEERMSDTAIEGALAPSGSDEGMDEGALVVEPVWLSEDFVKGRENLIDTDSIRGSGPAQVRPRAFQNRVYDPASSVSTDHRPRQ